MSYCGLKSGNFTNSWKSWSKNRSSGIKPSMFPSNITYARIFDCGITYLFFLGTCTLGAPSLQGGTYGFSMWMGAKLIASGSCVPYINMGFYVHAYFLFPWITMVVSCEKLPFWRQVPKPLTRKRLKFSYKEYNTYPKFSHLLFYLHARGTRFY